MTRTRLWVTRMLYRLHWRGRPSAAAAHGHRHARVQTRSQRRDWLPTSRTGWARRANAYMRKSSPHAPRGGLGRARRLTRPRAPRCTRSLEGPSRSCTRQPRLMRYCVVTHAAMRAAAANAALAVAATMAVAVCAQSLSRRRRARASRRASWCLWLKRSRRTRGRPSFSPFRPRRSRRTSCARRVRCWALHWDGALSRPRRSSRRTTAIRAMQSVWPCATTPAWS
mmetsp:Transcript_6768/g.27636  ORF Transcript_6768/g.27636 Transcript_6768/m.27636 type:complete len:225 (+) Transcript_6768:254-928(+)